MPSVSHFYIHREYMLWDAVLSNSWTDGIAILSTGTEDNGSIDAKDCNKLVLYFDATLGNATSIDVRVFFSGDGTTWFYQTTGTLVGGINTLNVYYNSMTASGQLRLSLGIMDRYIKIQVRGQGDITGSNLTAKAFVGTA